MDIQVKKPGFDKEFIGKVKLGEYKGAKVEIIEGDRIQFEVKAFGRLAGRMSFVKRDKDFKCVEKRIVESGFYPEQIILFEVVKYCKKHKIKNIIL